MKKLILLILIVVIFFGILGFIYGVKNNIFKPLSSSPDLSKTTNLKKETVQVKLALIPEKTMLKISEETNYIVKIKDNTLGVSIIECNLSYDPTILDVVKIDPGNFLTNPNVLNSSIDPVQGKISYTLASLKYSSGEGDLIKILIKAKSSSKTLNNIFNFDKNNVNIGLRNLDKKYSYGQDEIVIIFDEQPITISP